MNFDNMTYKALIIHCYDYRPELYHRLTAESSEAMLRAWLGDESPSTPITQIINQADKISINKQVVINNPTGDISF